MPPGFPAVARLGRSARGLARGPGRPAALGLAAALVGIAIAGIGLFHPSRNATATVPAGDVALVNGEPVLMSDFITETEQIIGVPFNQATPADRARILRSMIDQELTVQRALALDLPEQDTNVRSALDDSIGAVVSAATLATPPSDAELRAYYAANRARYATLGSMTLADLVLNVGGYQNADQTVDQALADAKQAVYELRSGAAVDYIKQHFSFIDSGRVSGAQLDFGARIHLGAKLYAVARTMSDGQISEPVADTDGVHVLIMARRQPPIFYDFEGVRANVYKDFVAARSARAKQDNIVFLRRNATILLAPGQRE